VKEARAKKKKIGQKTENTTATHLRREVRRYEEKNITVT
jgi:hypothetical protein